MHVKLRSCDGGTNGAEERDYNKAEKVFFCSKMFDNGSNSKTNAMRLIEIIDKSNCEDVIDYIVNAARAYGDGLISRERMYRIRYAIVNSMQEDLFFLKNHVFDEVAIEGNDNIFGLLKEGLVISAGTDPNNGINRQYYGISDLGVAADRYAISLDDEDHWERHKSFKNDVPILSGIISEKQWEEIEKLYS